MNETDVGLKTLYLGNWLNMLFYSIKNSKIAYKQDIEKFKRRVSALFRLIAEDVEDYILLEEILTDGHYRREDYCQFNNITEPNVVADTLELKRILNAVKAFGETKESFSKLYEILYELKCMKEIFESKIEVI